MTTTSEKFVRDLLLKGRTVDFVSDASGFPRQEVMRVLQQLRDERDQRVAQRGAPTTENSGKTPGESAENRSVPSDSVTERDADVFSEVDAVSDETDTESDGFPESERCGESEPKSLPEMRERVRQVQQPRPEFNARTTNAVQLLARAAEMDDRRVQAALGRARKAMTDLAAQVNRYDEQNGARERLAELEAEIRAIKAGLRGGKNKNLETRNESGEFACRKGCGKVSPNPQGRGAHERHCQADAAVTDDNPVGAIA